MKLYTSIDAAYCDRYAIDDAGFPSIVLMEHAARGVFEEILKRFSPLEKYNFLILYGPGNNGGDALCLARMLALKGAKVNLVEAISKPKTKDAACEMKLLKKSAMSILQEVKPSGVDKYIDDRTIVIDGVFGTGFKENKLDDKLIKLFKKVRSASFVIGLDIPSGVNADTGEVAPGAIHCDYTVTFLLPKVGIYTSPGSLYSGEVIVKDLFVPTAPIKTNYELVTEDFAQSLFKTLERKANSHKGTYGHVAIVSPQRGMEGAVTLSTLAALKTGAGMVTVVAIDESSDSIRDRMPMLPPEAMVLSVDEKSDLSVFKKFSALVIGPGYGRERKSILSKILEQVEIPLVIDADALNILSEEPKLLNILKDRDAILTPHPGEMSRLAKVDNVQESRLPVLESFVKGNGFCLLLKGYRSMLGRGDGSVFINYTGNPTLAKGGSGDVLSGMIGGFIAQGLKPWQAGVVAMYLHGLCADRLVAAASELSVLPTDIIRELGNVLKCLTQ